METWQKILRESITNPHDLPPRLQPSAGDHSALSPVIASFPMRVTPWFLSKIKEIGDPLWKQAIPDPQEIAPSSAAADPLHEERLSPVPCLVHKFSNRVLLLLSSQCAMYCRFCTRKRKVGRAEMTTGGDALNQAFDYIAAHREIRDVLLSGGDPLLCGDSFLEEVLTRLRRIDHVKIIRIGSRIPCTLPMRITPKLTAMLRRFQPLYLNTHFNHPQELTPEAEEACALLADAGIALGCQTVLLRGVNDTPETIAELMQRLVEMRVRPYYLFQGDLTAGTEHFHTPFARGREIMRYLHRHLSGMAIPSFSFDLPAGQITLRNPAGELCTVRDATDRPASPGRSPARRGTR